MPRFVELPVEGTNRKKWVFLCNPQVGPFGDSATQYFIGSFDGKKFSCEQSPECHEMDGLGKRPLCYRHLEQCPDNRHIVIAWMSNWQYANDVPTSQYRSANSMPRDLSLYTSEGETYVKVTPSPELLKLRDKGSKKRAFKVDRTYNLDKLLNDNSGTYEIELSIKNKDADVIGFQLSNDKAKRWRCTITWRKRHSPWTVPRGVRCRSARTSLQ